MSKMNISWIKPYQFRSFGDPNPIVLSPKLTIIFGRNGTGKSNLADAFEWFLFGYTTRRRKGDDFSREEYRGSYARNMYRAETNPYVEVQIQIDGADGYRLRRIMDIPRSGRFVDTESHLEALQTDGSWMQIEFSRLGLKVVPVYNPIVTQHGIQDFIHTRPIDRYRSISDALGLTDLVGFKDTFTSARNSFRDRPSPQVLAAKRETQSLIKHLRSMGLSDIADRWTRDEYDEQKDYDLVQQAVMNLIGRGETSVADTERILSRLRVEQSRAMQRVFDISPFRPRSDAGHLLDSLKGLVDTSERMLAELVQIAGEFSHALVTEYERKVTEFWNIGLDLVQPNSPNQCPFCGEATLTPNRLFTLKQQVEEQNAYRQTLQRFDRQIDACKKAVSDIGNLLGQLRVKTLTPEDAARLEAVFSGKRDELGSFMNISRDYEQVINHAAAVVSQAMARIDTLKRQVSPAVITEIPQIAQEIQSQIRTDVSIVDNGLSRYSETITQFMPVLTVELSDETEVARYTAAIELLGKRSSVSHYATYVRLLGELLRQQQAISEYVVARQRDVLSEREREMLHWFSELAPNAATRFSGIEPETDRFVLKADCFGHELSAPACLSHSQLSCLGLSVCIPSVTTSLSPFGFLVFDDPVQAMDDEHKESFATKVVRDLMETAGIQVIIMTHLEPFANRLRDEHFDLEHTVYHFDGLTPEGSRLQEFRVVADEFSHIRRLMVAGDTASHRLAVDRMRVLGEHLIREAYLKEHGTPLPYHEYSSARTEALLKVMNELAILDQRQKQGLIHTIRWADPAHHSDVGWQVPDASNIQPHLDRLYGIARSLGIIRS